MFALCDHLGIQRAALGGAGLGASVVERAALSRPDRVFEHFEELRALTLPTLVIAGNDPRHPRELGEQYGSVLPGATRAEMPVWEGISTPEAFAARVVPPIEQFLVTHARTWGPSVGQTSGL